MGSLSNDTHEQVGVITVPFPAQGHLNQLLQLSCLLVSTYGTPVHYVGSAVHNRQARARMNGLHPQHVANINFHDIPTPPFASPPPDHISNNKFPRQLQPAFDSTLKLRQPVAAYLRDMAARYRRVVVVHDTMMAYVVQDVSSIPNAESYALCCVSAFSLITFVWAARGLPFPEQYPKELLCVQDLATDEILYLNYMQFQPMNNRAGDIYNTCRLMEAPYLEMLESEDQVNGIRKSWAIGPILPTKLSPPDRKYNCLEWLDNQEPNSVLYVSFGTTVSMSDDHIKEIALGLEQSRVKFLWVLRDADKGDIFDGQVRRAELPEGFEERVEGVGMVVRDWAPQPQILAHASTGGFMSHCGWNSCIESITMGVPLAAWPMHSDQPSNTAFVVDVLGIGVVVREWKQRMEAVKASTIESVVRRLMGSEEGDEIRKMAEELGAAVRKATQPGGASRIELDSFIAHITR